MSNSKTVSEMTEDEQQEIFDKAIGTIRLQLDLVAALASMMNRDTRKEWCDLVLEFNLLVGREY